MVPRASSPPLIPKTPIEIKKDREIASAKLDKLLKLPTVQKMEYGAVLDPCNSFHLRHRMVQSFLWIIQKRDQFPGTTERQLAYMVARSFNRGNHTSKKIIQWTNSWVNKGIIPKTQSGQHKHNFSWMDDEDVELAVCESICQQGESKYYVCTPFGPAPQSGQFPTAPPPRPTNSSITMPRKRKKINK